MSTSATHRLFRLRPLAALPFFCNPLYLFVSIWIVMLATLELQVSWSTFPDRSLGFAIFIVSVLAMAIGYTLAKHTEDSFDPARNVIGYVIRTEPLRKVIWILGVGCFLLMIYNYLAFGLPPAAAFIGFSTYDYQEYGRFKQLLQPMLGALFLCSLLEPSRLRRWLGSSFALGIMIVYVLRGPLLMALAQAIILSSIRSQTSKRKIYIRAGAMILIGLLLMSIIGNYRTPQDIFLSYMEIKPEFRNWPMALLWPITYVSVPISNLCWIIHGAHFTQPTMSFLYPVLPAFWTPTNPHDSAVSDSHIIDGVHTYLANYFLDFSWLGVIAANFGIGMLSGFLVNRQRITRYVLISPVILSAMAFIFFWDFFIYLPTLGQLGIQAIIQHLCIAPVRQVPSTKQPVTSIPAT